MNEYDEMVDTLAVLFNWKQQVAEQLKHVYAKRARRRADIDKLGDPVCMICGYDDSLADGYRDDYWVTPNVDPWAWFEYSDRTKHWICPDCVLDRSRKTRRIAAQREELKKGEA